MPYILKNVIFKANEKLKSIEIYFLPLVAFFILFSTAVVNFFILSSVIITLLRIFENKYFLNLISKKFMLYGILIFFFLCLSSYYSIGNFETIFITLKKYVKFLYIPILFYSIKIHKNHYLIINYFLRGAAIVLFLSYLKYFAIIDFTNLYNYFDMNLVGTLTKASVFQTSIVHGAIFSFVFYLSVFMARKDNNFFYYLFSIFCLFNVIFMNDSKNSYIIAILLIFLVIYFYFYKRKYVVTILSFLFLFIISMSPLSETFIKSLNEASSDVMLLTQNNFTSSTGLRALWAINGFYNLYNKPILGSGVGSYYKTIEDFVDKKNIDVQSHLAISNNPHNEFVSISTQLGLFGLILYILFLYRIFKESLGNFLGLGVFVIISVSSFFNSALYDNVFGLFIVLILSLVYQKDLYE